MKNTIARPRFTALTIIALALGAAAALRFTACVPLAAPAPQEGVTDVLMQNIAFVPNQVTIRAGQSVRWTNVDPVIHTTTSGNPGDPDVGSLWDSGNMNPGESFTHQFDEPGEFIYFCEVHPNIMRNARVIVEPADGSRSAP